MSSDSSAVLELPGWSLAERKQIKEALSNAAFAEKLAQFQAVTSNANFVIEYDSTGIRITTDSFRCRGSGLCTFSYCLQLFLLISALYLWPRRRLHVALTE